MTKSDRVALVTGAGSGIGRCVALELASRGYRLALVGRTKSKLDKTAKMIVDAGGGEASSILPADLCDPDAARGVVEQAAKKLGRIDAIANVAGYAPSLPIEEATAAIVRQCLDANLTSVIHITAAAWPILKRQGGGVIANVSSMAAFDPYPGLSIYAAAKAGLNMLTACTATEGEPYQIHAFGVAPGAVETPMLRAIFDTDAIPTDMTLAPEEVAGLVCDCVTGVRAYELGETIEMPSP